jgi:hypothetical protein
VRIPGTVSSTAVLTITHTAPTRSVADSDAGGDGADDRIAERDEQQCTEPSVGADPRQPVGRQVLLEGRVPQELAEAGLTSTQQRGDREQR